MTKQFKTNNYSNSTKRMTSTKECHPSGTYQLDGVRGHHVVREEEEDLQVSGEEARHGWQIPRVVLEGEIRNQFSLWFLKI